MKNISMPPIGIIITMGKEMIEHNGGLRVFLEAFEDNMADDTGCWFHKCKNAPQHDIAQVYIIIGRRIYARVFFGGHQDHPTVGYRANGEELIIEWPRLVLSGPIEKPRRKIPMRGFQGFRYIYEALW